MNRSFARSFCLAALCLPLAGCFGGMKPLKIVDFTEERVTDLDVVRKVAGKSEFFFFSTTRMRTYLEGNIHGVITDYQGNPIEGVPVRAVTDSARPRAASGVVEGVENFEMAAERNAASAITYNFTPGITDSMGAYKIHFSLPVTDEIVDISGKLLYNPGWDQQKINLGKAYEPQQKETAFRLYYNMKNGSLIFAEGIRKVIVEPVGDGKVRPGALPGVKAPGAAPSASPAGPAGGAAPAAGAAEEDLFKSFDFGQ